MMAQYRQWPYGGCQLASFAEVYNTVLDYLLPERCGLCSGPTTHGFCVDCQAEFTSVTSPCPRCGLAQPVRRCPQDRDHWHLAGIIAPLRYEFPLSAEIHALKFSRRRSYGRALGLLLAEHLRTRAETNLIDTIVAVPLHRRRLRERGYNQALEIARPVAAELRIPLLIAGITRSLPTRPQAELDLRERQTSVANVFSVSRNLCGRHIAIVDDVITTGATVNSLAGALLSAGATEVYAWSVSRTL